MNDLVRIDKWLWSVRIYKTRSLATEQCKAGKVSINGQAVKPSRMLNLNEIVLVRKPPLTYHYQVTGLISKRVSAKVAAEHVKDITPQEELDRLQNIQESAFFVRPRGEGRPTKKERRDIDKFRTE